MPVNRIADRLIADARVAAAPRPTPSDAKALVSAAYQVLVNLGLRDARHSLPDTAWSAASRRSHTAARATPDLRTGSVRPLCVVMTPAALHTGSTRSKKECQ